MFTTRHFASRTLIWLAALAIPSQGLPSKSCGCTDSKACCQSAGQVLDSGARNPADHGTCCRSHHGGEGKRSCCSHSSVDGDSPCQCGMNCRCGENEQPTPAAPPVENDSTEKISADAVSTAALVVCPSFASNRHLGFFDEAAASTALDRCVTYFPHVAI